MGSAHVEHSSHTTGYDPRRLATHDMEIGITDAVQRHVQRHVVAPKPVSQRKLDFEHSRPRWMREMAAESLGTGVSRVRRLWSPGSAASDKGIFGC